MAPTDASNTRPIWWNDRYDLSWERAKLSLPQGTSHDEWSFGTRYGFGAGLSHTHHPHPAWNESLEDDLRRDWERMRAGPRWHAVRSRVRQGFELARRR